MGLLDDPNTLAQLQLGAGLLGGGSFGQALNRGLLGYQGTLDGAADRKNKTAYMQAQIEERAANAAKDRAAVLAQQRRQEALSGMYGPQGGAGGVPGADGAAQAMGGNPGSIDIQRLVQAGVPPDEIMKYAALRNANRDKVARTVEGMDAQGRPVTTQFDEYGQAVGAPLQQWKAPVMVNQGNRISAVDPVSLQAKQSFGIGQSPDSAASTAVSWANNSLARQRLAMDQNTAKSEGSTKGAPSGYRWKADGSLEAIPGGPVGDGKMTEDQGKATGWLVQAENAFGNMMKVGADKEGNPTSAAKPGINDAIGAVPGLAPVANKLRGRDRQMFLQASSSLSESLLRAATGAGVNKDEAAQKIQELTPQYGEDPEVTKQKYAAIPLYIESLKVRAGPGAAKAQNVLSNSQPTKGAPMRGQVIDGYKFKGGNPADQSSWEKQ